MINKEKHILPISSLKTLYMYSSLIHSHVNDGVSIWGTSHTLNTVYKLQKNSIRIIHNKPYNYHTEPLFKHSKILKIDYQYKLNAVTLMHQLKHNKLPTSFFTQRTGSQPDNKSLHNAVDSEHLLHQKFLCTISQGCGMNYSECVIKLHPHIYIKQRFKQVYLTHTQIKLHVTMTDANNVIQTYMYGTLTENM